MTKVRNEKLLGPVDFVKSSDVIVRLVVMMAVMCRAHQLLVPRQVGLEVRGRSWCEEKIQVSCFSEQRVRKKKRTWVAKMVVPGPEKSFPYWTHWTGDYQDVRDQPF